MPAAALFGSALLVALLAIISAWKFFVVEKTPLGGGSTGTVGETAQLFGPSPEARAVTDNNHDDDDDINAGGTAVGFGNGLAPQQSTSSSLAPSVSRPCFPDPESVGAGSRSPWECTWHTAGLRATPVCCCRNKLFTRCLPSVVQIGAQKAGTTALVAYLLQHPDYVHANRKETHHFDRRRSVRIGLGMYLRNFPNAPQPLSQHFATITGESTPSYAVGDLTPQRMHAMLPEAQVVFMVRNPTDRAFSEYKMALRRQHIQDAVTRWLKDRLVPFVACVVDTLPAPKRVLDKLVDVLPPADVLRQFREARPPQTSASSRSSSPSPPVQLPLPPRARRHSQKIQDRMPTRRKTLLDGCVSGDMLGLAPVSRLLMRWSNLPALRTVAAVQCLAQDPRLWRWDTDSATGTVLRPGLDVGDTADEPITVSASGGEADADAHLLTCLRNHIHNRTLDEHFSVPGGMRASFSAEMRMAKRCRDPVSGIIAVRDRERDCFVGAGAARVTQDHILRGLYAQQLRRWYQFYPPERVFVAFQEDLERNGTGVMRELAAFLGLAEHAWRPMDRDDVSAVIQRRFPRFERSSGWVSDGGKSFELDLGLRRELDSFFRPHNKELREMLGNRDLPPSWSGAQGEP